MSKQIGSYIAEWMINNNIITDNEKPIYEYCYTYLIENTLYAVIILLISILLHCFDIGLILVTFQFSLRVTGGGAHASTRKMCTFVSYGQDILILLLVPLSVDIKNIYWMLLFTVGAWIIFIAVPVDCPNKRLDNAQKKEFRKRCLICLFIIICLFLLFLYFNLTRLYITASICVIIDSIGLILGIMNNYKETKC